MNTLETLRKIYWKYLKKYPGNPDSGQMCCMWSTSDPPDDIYESDQIASIEEAFDMELSEDEAMQIYDMRLIEAASKIDELKQVQT